MGESVLLLTALKNPAWNPQYLGTKAGGSYGPTCRCTDATGIPFTQPAGIPTKLGCLQAQAELLSSFHCTNCSASSCTRGMQINSDVCRISSVLPAAWTESDLLSLSVFVKSASAMTKAEYFVPDCRYPRPIVQS